MWPRYVSSCTPWIACVETWRGVHAATLQALRQEVDEPAVRCRNSRVAAKDRRNPNALPLCRHGGMPARRLRIRSAVVGERLLDQVPMRDWGVYERPLTSAVRGRGNRPSSWSASHPLEQVMAVAPRIAIVFRAGIAQRQSRWPLAADEGSTPSARATPSHSDAGSHRSLCRLPLQEWTTKTTAFWLACQASTSHKLPAHSLSRQRHYTNV